MADSIRDVAERYCNGEADLVHEYHPVRPVFKRASEELADGLLMLKSVASVDVVDTGDGLVMLDTGGAFDVDRVFEAVRALAVHSQRTAAAVYSHHHIDHVFGTKRFDGEAAERGWPRPRVYGHDNILPNFRRYAAVLRPSVLVQRVKTSVPPSLKALSQCGI